eukprot:SAG31_NODE_189_length_20842_cov_12.518151_11_plen_91_part_00
MTRHLEREETGALETIWQKQQEKKEAWFLSLLAGLKADEDYQNAKAKIAAQLGLRAEEIDDELEDQEIAGLEQGFQVDDPHDLDSDEYAE